ncbi:MAG: ATP-binding protein [Burkholderiales bacterium]
MKGEGQTVEKKSLSIIAGGKADFDVIARECVGFANARGGHLHVGIEDEADQPPDAQRIDDSLLESLQKRIPQLTHNVIIAPTKVTAANSGEYIDLVVSPTQHIACTSDGRYFLRVGDECRRVMPDDLMRLMNDKAAFVWETQVAQQAPRARFDTDKRRRFLEMIHASDRVSDFVKAKTDDEILAYYIFVKEDCLTNLGVLWVGVREDRATLSYAPAIQFIKYDETGRKVNKLTWDDYYLNPYELIEAVWRGVPDWRESYELPEGLFRKSVLHYDERVIRELLANALVHRPYTQRGDIFLNLHPDRLEVHNPGLLPIGVTARNILHASVARNQHLSQVFRDLKLMEREGSGYDMIYDVLLSNGKQIPEVIEGDDRVTVIIRKRIIKTEIVDFVAKADQTFQLTQRERVALGLIAQHESLTALNLSSLLALKNAEDVRHWTGRLQKLEIVKTKGRTKGTEYYVDPALLRRLDFKGATTLKGIEPHRLRELILSDLGVYLEASIAEINARIGEEIPPRKIRRELQKLVQEGLVRAEGEKKGRRYILTKRP